MVSKQAFASNPLLSFSNRSSKVEKRADRRSSPRKFTRQMKPLNASLLASFLPGKPLLKAFGKSLVCCLPLFFAQPTFAQQEPQFTKYMFNSLVFNPGYAGSKEYLSAVVLYRDQWFGWGTKGGSYDGRPVTQTFSLHTPVNSRIGLGLNVVNDRIGARKTSFANLCYAYRVSFGKGTLSLGLQAGLMSWRADWEQLSFKDAREFDLAFQGTNPSLLLPDFGAGIYFYSKHFYVGASIPHLAHLDFREVDSIEQATIRKWAKSYRHFYFTTGGVVPLGGDGIVFKPSLLIKSVGFFNDYFKQGSFVREIGAPTSFDLDLSLFFYEKLWVGAAFRSAFSAFAEKGAKKSSYDSIDAWVAFYLGNGLRIGFAYDYPLGQVLTASPGSFELMLGYDFFKKVEKVNHPRYF
jgi:type IX secretion system PorP/SprF family membrane protein